MKVNRQRRGRVGRRNTRRGRSGEGCWKGLRKEKRWRRMSRGKGT